MWSVRAFSARAQLGTLALYCASAHAQALPATPASRTLQVDYSAPDVCPTRAEFVAAILTREPLASVIDSNEAAIHLRVEVVSGGRSTLWIDLENGSSRRDVDGASCQDAVASMALIAAMVLEATPEERPLAADRAMAQSGASETAQPGPAKAVVPAPSSSVPAAAAVASPAVHSRQLGFWAGSLSLELITESAVAWPPPLGLAAGVELRRTSLSGWGVVGRAEALATLAATERDQDGAADLRLLAGRVSACASKQLSQSWRVLPCITFDAGELYAAGTQVAAAQKATMPWLACGLLLRAHYDLNAAWGIEAALGAKLLARHDRFYFRPSSTVYEVPPFSAGATFGLDFRVF